MASFLKMKSTLNCGGKLLDLSSPRVMGILNVTPDSFFDGGKYELEEDIVDRAAQIIDQGGDVIDVGAFSSRPGALEVSFEEELSRLVTALKTIKRHFPDVIISIDTYRAKVAKTVVEDYGVDIINDISGGDLDGAMFATIAKLGVPYVLMHMSGTPQSMQQNPQYADVTKAVISSFAKKTQALRLLGVTDIILDPGFGFGKTMEHNYELVNRFEEFNVFELPVLVGVSRKSMIYKQLGVSAQESLNGTSVLHTVLLQKGASLLRVHDVKEAVECIKLTAKLQNKN